MKKNYVLLLLFAAAIAFTSCSKNDDDTDYEPVSPVVLDLTQVPYAKLSDYHFFEGEMKNLEPAYRVIPFKPNSELFTDYARKKRFIWMPSGVQASYVTDDSAMDFPVGTVLIKNFYYDDVLPNHTQQIIETRLLVKVADDIAESGNIAADSGWKLYNYIWNAEQTEAFLNQTGNGQSVPISFVVNGETKTTDYQIPSSEQCMTCHKLNANHTPFGEVTVPLGVKPQNLNYAFNYGTSQQNQLAKWQATGYLDNSVPNNITSTVDWTDVSQPLELRARSYLDANCAHCHRAGAYCDYTNMRFNFRNANLELLGVCMVANDQIGSPYTHIIARGNWSRSDIGFRMSATAGGEMMPQIGRTLVHNEGLELMQQWVMSLDGHCE